MKTVKETKLNAVKEHLDEVKQEIIKYINYYNNERLVWKIKDSPTKYRESFYSNV